MAFSPHSFMFQPLHQDHHHLLSHPPQLFHGVGNGGDDDKSHHDEKKIKRLNMEQVKALEKSFELGNKIEPDRKLQLAKDLGLKPRQIAIWFQNRRARYKNKQLEKDYDSLKKLFEALKSDNHTLQSQNNKLTAQLMSLKTKDSNEIFRAKNENEGSCSDNSFDVNLDISRTTLRGSSIRPSRTTLRGSSIRPSRTTLRGSSIRPATTMGSSKPDLHCHQVVQDDQSLACHMFNVVDEQQQGFWPWAADQSIKFPLN